MQIALSSSYADLQSYFAPLLKSQIQTFKKKDFSLLEVAGYPDYENVISNLYAFFLNESEHGTGKLFMSGLRDCLAKCNLDIQIDSWNTKREVTTEKGRIDIAIEEVGDNPDKVIIIENKIYHGLLNDLNDYYEHYSKSTQRVGVVLSLHPIKDTPSPFVNITHIKWIEAVKARIGEVLPGIPLKHLMLLQDFIAHVESYHEKVVTMESYKFLFENAEKISVLNDLVQKAIDQLKKGVYESIGPDWEQYRSSASSIALKRKELSIVLYITTDGIFKPSEPHFVIQLWLRGKSVLSSWKGKIVPPNTDGIELYNKGIGNEWMLIANKWYDLKIEDITDFNAIVKKYLSNEWERFITQIEPLIQ